ncbi:MAG: hypothetical protein KN64_06005 [Sulfurovum sp. AS07-7]|nr:MAG: hypothetical protein KN64_06005 [Sulfurovum sp. AS07-7]
MKKILLTTLLMLNISFGANVFATFETKAQKSAKLAFSSSGIVKKIYVDVGSNVKKGQILASLQNDDLLALANMARSQAKFASLEYQRYSQVKEYINKNQLDSYKLKRDNAITQQRYSESMLNKTVLRAPFSGVITSKNIEEGDVVTSQGAATNAFGIQSVGSMKLVIKFDARYYGLVKAGQPFIFQIGGKGAKLKTTISKVYPSVDEKTQMAVAEAKIDNLPSGLFGAGTIVTGK